MDEISKKLKNLNPCISREFAKKLIKNPKACKELIAKERYIADKVDLTVMKILCSKEFLRGLLKKKKP
ncbi:MAG: hypothetical protein U9Q97_04770, partial [Acidobacteriota bacterium]|nr:hypothetical protein [Acidobacteriota bacterium]